MKKRILLALAVIMLMCGFVFSANAVDETCENGYHTMQIVAKYEPTCTDRGYDLYSCVVCGEHHIKTNYTNALGHLWSDVDSTPYKYQEDKGCYYHKLKCLRNCGQNDVAESEKIDGVETPIEYYNVQFVNNYYYDVLTADDYKTLSATELKNKEKQLKANQRDNTVKYAYLAKDKENIKALQSTYVKKGDSVRYQGADPFRYKTKDYGGYRFLGWTESNKSLFTEAADKATVMDRSKTIENVQRNIIYYTAWEPMDVYYSVVFYNSDGEQLTDPQSILHGQTSSYIFSYPAREESVGFEYEFDGWEIGTTTISTDPLDIELGVYEHFTTDVIHASEIPIYSDDAIRAVHKEIPRKYNYVIYDNNGNILVQVPEIDYGLDRSSLVNIKGANDDTLESNDLRGVYEDDKYVYEFTGYWQTDDGTRMSLSSMRPPLNSIDFDDEIYLKDSYGNYIMDGENKLVIEDLQEKYRNIFDLNTQNFVAVVDKNGNNILKGNGQQLWLYIDKGGIYVSTVDEEITTPFTDDDAHSLRNINLKPIYNKRVREYPLTIKAIIPENELVPGDYSKLVVQITDTNGLLMASGITGSVSNNTTSVTLRVKYSEVYRITVVSENGKYMGESRQLWNVLKPDKAGKEIPVNLEITEGYSSAVNKRCSCICHNTFLRPIWVRILNLIYRFFGKGIVCCYDMEASIGNLLIY